MSLYIEPIYLNEKMVLNCAAYVFKGVSMESEVSESSSTKNKGNLNLGFKFLNDLISPIGASAEQNKEKTSSQKSARRYTLGGLHMTLIDALMEQGHIYQGTEYFSGDTEDKFIELPVILKPIDFYSIIEAIRVASPLICQVLHNFGHKFNPNIFDRNFKADIAKYETLISKVLEELERDYLKSGQLEMIMIDPRSKRQVGVLDVDVSDQEPLAVKAKLTDGRFRVIGRVSRKVDEGDSISLVQRTVLSSFLSILEKFVSATSGIEKYQSGMGMAKVFAQQVCQLNLPGPALRVMAMSICI